MNKVITVSREFGSGGRELGVKLAEALGIPFYDKELISMAADDINIAEEAFRKYDEHVIEDDPLDHKIHHSFSELYKCLCLIRFCGPVQCDPQTGFSWPMCDRRTLRRYDPGGQREHFHIFKNETAHKTSDGTGTGRRHQRKRHGNEDPCC